MAFPIKIKFQIINHFRVQIKLRKSTQNVKVCKLLGLPQPLTTTIPTYA